MADKNGTGFNLSNFHVKPVCSAANVNIEEVENEKIIKTETEVVGGSWEHQDREELLQNINQDRSLECGNAVEQLLNDNYGEVCEHCKTEYKDYCRDCEHLRAIRSIPKTILEIKGSLMKGYGVYALRNIPKGVMFGPYEGLETVKIIDKYLWKIRYTKLIEANGEDHCNWMKFIDCATIQTEQNLIALQFMGKMYYNTLKEIEIGEELLIYYNHRGSDPLGLCSIQYFEPAIHEMNTNIFKCLPCCYEFSKETYLVNHNMVCPHTKKEVTEVNSTMGAKDFEDHTKICGRINNLSLNCQKDNESEERHKKVGLGGEEEQDCIENMKINNKVEKKKLKFPHSHSGCLTTDSLKKQVMMHKKKSYKKQKSEHSIYRCKTTKQSSLLPTRKKEESYYKANKLTSNHTMEKRYKCNECSYAAVRKDHLLAHIRSHHTMEKPYKCNECSYAAVQKSCLVSHIIC